MDIYICRYIKFSSVSILRLNKVHDSANRVSLNDSVLALVQVHNPLKLHHDERNRLPYHHV